MNIIKLKDYLFDAKDINFFMIQPLNRMFIPINTCRIYQLEDSSIFEVKCLKLRNQNKLALI